MILNLIKSNPAEKREAQGKGAVIMIAEMFCNTIQGEGINAGYPATFLRVKDCTLKCTWCDTLEDRRFGNPYSVSEILDMWELNGMIDKFKYGQHLILTGGSPLLQQEALLSLLVTFHGKYGFLPYVEVENECVLLPHPDLIPYVNCWNNSPKLANSGMKEKVRYKEHVIHHMNKLPNSWFKFVVSSEADWSTIYHEFIATRLISRNSIILMPEGQTREQLQRNYDLVVEIAVENNIRMCDRMHVTMWDKKTGV